jgi:hypothetical protein
MIALLYIPVTILLGYLNALWVEKKGAPGKKKIIRHFWNGLLHCIAAGLVYLKTKDWTDAIALLAITRVFFNESYNYFHIPRHPLGYISKTSKSIIDKIQYKLFGSSGVWAVILWILIAITLLII